LSKIQPKTMITTRPIGAEVRLKKQAKVTKQVKPKGNNLYRLLNIERAKRINLYLLKKYNWVKIME